MATHDQRLRHSAENAPNRARKEILAKEISWEFPRFTDEPAKHSDQRDMDRKWESWRWPANW